MTPTIFEKFRFLVLAPDDINWRRSKKILSLAPAGTNTALSKAHPPALKSTSFDETVFLLSWISFLEERCSLKEASDSKRILKILRLFHAKFAVTLASLFCCPSHFLMPVFPCTSPHPPRS